MFETGNAYGKACIKLNSGNKDRSNLLDIGFVCSASIIFFDKLKHNMPFLKFIRDINILNNVNGLLQLN